MKEFLKNMLLARKDLVGAPSGFSFEFGTKREIIDKLYSIAKNKGYQEVNTPMFDFFEVYEKTLGSGTKELFVFKDGNDFIVPRYDITTQIVRFLAPRIKQYTLPIRVFYCGDVFREPEFRWHPRQIKQFGIELIGGKDENITEILTILKEMLDIFIKHKTFDEYKLIFNFSKIIEITLEEIPQQDKELLRYLISNKDIPSIRKILGKESKIEKLIYLSFEDSNTIKTKLSEILQIDTKEIVEEISKVEKILENSVFDPTLVSEMDYYSGIFFKVYSNKFTYPIASGGRYDNLTKKFNYSQTAMGFAIDII